MTGAAVDLAAVRTARRALAAIAAEHPELTSATAHARLAEHLPEIIAMKSLDSNATGAARTITVTQRFLPGTADADYVVRF